MKSKEPFDPTIDIYYWSYGTRHLIINFELHKPNSNFTELEKIKKIFCEK